MTIAMKDKWIYVLLLLASMISCVLRYPDFDTMLWSASDTNYQCLMNAKAMIEAEEGVDRTLPIITYSEDTDYGLEYSSGAFDQESGKYFYYVSFPAFPFIVCALFFRFTGMPVSVEGMYLFTSVLFCFSVLVTVRLFILLFGARMEQKRIAWITGITYLLSTEIMHSMGLTYWGQNWYMILFPALCIVYLRFMNTETPGTVCYLAFLGICLLMLQTEWTAYFAAFAFWLVMAVHFRKSRAKKYLILQVGIFLEVVITLLVFFVRRASIVGIKDLISVLMQRTMGRSRVSDYSLLSVEAAVWTSFGAMLILLLGYGAWRGCERLCHKEKENFWREYGTMMFLFAIPLLENHVFTNHALTYTMDRMKWYFLLQILLLWLVSGIQNTKQSRKIVDCTLAVCMGISMICYLCTENAYRWQDIRLRASSELQEYIAENYEDCVYGQLGDNSVWGYSKLLFGHGISKETSIENLIKRAEQFDKRYAVALNDQDLAYTQKWYSSAVIYDTQKEKYYIVGSLKNQYMDKIKDIQYVMNAQYVELYVDSFEKCVQKITFTDTCSLSDKERAVKEKMEELDQQQTIVYFKAEADEVPDLIMVNDQNGGEWQSGVSQVQNRLIFLNTEGNAQILGKARTLSVNDQSARLLNVFEEGDFIYADLETDDVSVYAYPATVIAD